MDSFGDLFGGLGELIGGIVGGVTENASEGVVAAGIEALSGNDDEPQRSEGTATYERRLAGAPRALNVNDI